QLAQQGYVEKRSGIGTTVLDNNAVSKLSKGQRFSEYLLDESHKLSKECVHLSSVNTTNHLILADLFYKTCHCVERLYKLNDEQCVGTQDEKIAEMLKIEQKPLLQRFRFSIDENENLVEYSEAFYNTKIHRYVVNFDM